MYHQMMLSLRLPERQLRQRCRDEDIGDISLHFRWRTVAPFLHLSQQQVEDIDVDGRCEQERRILTLRTWQQTFGDRATYGMLIRALIKTGLREQARNVARIMRLRSSSNSSSESAGSTRTEEFFTPPQSPPRLGPKTVARHTQTEETIPLRLDVSSDVISTPPVTKRVSNVYVPLPLVRARGREQAAKVYLSTTISPQKDSSTQTEAVPSVSLRSQPTSHFQVLPSRPQAMSPHFQATPTRPQAMPSHSQATPTRSQAMPFQTSPPPFGPQTQLLSSRLSDVEKNLITSRTPGSTQHQYSRRCICLFLIVPILAVLGLVILIFVIIYGLVYAQRS